MPANKVYEDDHIVAFLDIKPSVNGHVLIVPKTHHEDLLRTPSAILDQLMLAVQKIAPAAMNAVGARAFNLGVNTGADAGQIIFHTHIHILPRSPGDGKTLWGHRDASADELKLMAEKIRANL